MENVEIFYEKPRVRVPLALSRTFGADVRTITTTSVQYLCYLLELVYHRNSKSAMQSFQSRLMLSVV